MQVQNTNDSSIVSKLSAENKGYFQDNCLKMFVDKEQTRSPIINRVLSCIRICLNIVLSFYMANELGPGTSLNTLCYCRLPKETVAEGTVVHIVPCFVLLHCTHFERQMLAL
ncbi:hypothetical protein AVEN_17964-1 [Araneus ventricosus]|uniref:Uncharacterized protein n=1 Tax=Araneus ventricosus TaxID=182803 RepID=A0A4Y2WNV6_ARAVE|nr:hypothetical protein AVEN_17964-1 [Araneus ventricosus]